MEIKIVLAHILIPQEYTHTQVIVILGCGKITGARRSRFRKGKYIKGQRYS